MTERVDGYMCCRCGKIVYGKECIGSATEPYCKDCFSKRFKSMEEYLRHLNFQ